MLDINAARHRESLRRQFIKYTGLVGGALKTGAHGFSPIRLFGEERYADVRYAKFVPADKQMPKLAILIPNE